MDDCWTTVPDLYMLGETRAASCFLYRAAPALTDRDLAATFVSSPQASGKGQAP